MTASGAFFATWIGTWGLGAAEAGFKGALFGLFAGLVWGSIFSYFNVRVLWQAFDLPSKDYQAEYDETMHTDLAVLFSRGFHRILTFKPTPGFKASGVLPWALFVAALLLPVLWTWAFCLITWLTEGAPGVNPVAPLGR